MDQREILSKVDHTLLKPEAAWEEIRALCDEAVKWGTASVCIPPCYVGQAAEYLGGRLPVCTVVGFPNGYSTTQAKLFETREALAAGAQEIDMVINIGWLKAGNAQGVLEEIRALKEACGEKILKVIVEACLLTREEKVEMCRIVTEAGADYIKTSTGFSTAGASFEDVEFFAQHIGPHVRIKAAVGISSFEDAVRFIGLGASRLGTGRLVRLAAAGI